MRIECERCGLHAACLHPYLQPEGPIETAEILFIAEAPGENEDILQRPLIGESGQILRKALIKAKLEDSYDLNPSTNYGQTPFVKNVVLYNVCVCRPPGNDTPTGMQIKCCFDNTLDLIKRMPTLKLIVPVGNIALRAFTGKQGITSVSGKEMAWEGYKMMPLIHPASFLYAKNRSKIKIFYDHMERIHAILNDNLITDDAGIYRTIKSIETWRDFNEELVQQSEFTYDIETTGRNPFVDGFRIKLITFNFKYKEAWALPIWDESTGEQWNDADYTEILNDLKWIFENESIGKIGHNIKYDNLCMKVIYDIEVAGTIGDTKLSQYILHPQDSDWLKDMAWSYSGLGGYEKSLSVDTQDASLEELIPYSSKDADLTGRIYSIHNDEFGKNPILFNTYRNLFVPVQIVLSKMEYNGIRVNPPRLNDSYRKAKKILDKTIEDINNYPAVKKYVNKTKKDFNIDSDAQIRIILFSQDYEKLHPIKMTSKLKVPSTDKTVFEYFATKNPFAALLFTYSKYTAIMKTINDIKANLTPDNRIHTSYWITSTFSGRSSSSNPNLQNLPKGDNDPVLIRKAFIADDNYNLVEFDFNQHELRCMAEEADDDAMRKACISGDVHKATTANLLGISPDKVTDEQRRNIGKVFNFGLIYGMTVYGIAKKMKLIDKIMAKDKSLSFKQAKWLAEKEAQVLLDKFFAVYFNIKKWMDKTAQFVIDNRYVTMRSGLTKYFPSDIKLTDHELRSAINIPIQGLAGHILFYALIGVDRFITFNKLQSKLLLEVHDSIVMGIHKSELEIIPEIKYIMCNYFKKFMEFKTPLKVDAKIGENWKIMEEI